MGIVYSAIDKRLDRKVAIKVLSLSDFSTNNDSTEVHVGKWNIIVHEGDEGGEEHVHEGKFSSGEFKADEAWRVQFNDAGTFFFHDHLNPKLNILVVVYTPGANYKIPQ